MNRAQLSATLLVLFGASVAQAQQPNTNFDTWLNKRIDEAVAVRLSVRDTRKQPLMVAGSASDANLVDRSNMPDIVGISVKLPDQPASDNAERGSNSISATPYLLTALLKGGGFDATTYARQGLSRRLGLNATFDTDSTGKMTHLVQAKFLVVTRGNILKVDTIDRVGPALKRATREYAALTAAVLDLFCARLCAGFDVVTKDDTTRFENGLNTTGTRDARIAMMGSAGMSAVDNLIVQHVESFVKLKDLIGSLEEKARSRPEVSVGLTLRNGVGETANATRALVIVDWGTGRNDLTFNLGYEQLAAVDTIPEKNRIAAAGQFLWRLSTADQLTGRTAASLAIAASAGVDPGNTDDRVYKLQAKLLLPIAEGMNVPLSISWASRAELIDEAQVRGLVGFTFNVAQIFAGLQ